MTTLLFLCLLLLSPRTLASLSGLYIDNGVDQTVMEHSMSALEKKEVEHEILNLLGLQERPRLKRKILDPKAALGRSAPNFLLDVYKSLAENPSSRTTRSEFNLSEKDLNAIHQSDAIITFASHNRHVPNLRHERGKRLWFDVSEVTSGENLVGAELRLYQTANFSLPPKEGYTLTVYMVLNTETEQELEFVDSINTTGDHDGWLIFNMSNPLMTWLSHPETNKGIYLSLHHTQSPGHELSPEDIGVLSTGGEIDKEPFMVAFLRGGPELGKMGSGPAARRRVRRQSSRRKKKTTDSSYHRNPLTDRGSWVHQQRSCQIQTLFVSFKDLHWQDWIIAPDGYGAFYCSGECNFPLNSHMNATNHAVVQTLVHLMNPLEVPKPCCAPTKLTPISVLFFHDESNVILKKYKNMVVKSCGCH